MNVLIVDDDRDILQALAISLESPEWEIDTSSLPLEALEMIERYQVLITDVRMPEMDGLQLLKEARKRNPSLEVLVMTAYVSVANAVEAIQGGARAYVMKPPDMRELMGHLKEIQSVVRLRGEAMRLRRSGLVGASPAMQKVYRSIDECACSMASVLITGETGTGKELAARAIHQCSSRKHGPFVSMNVANVPAQLAESELFGHRKGAFTGADRDHPGRFMLASGGSLFLDEVNSLPMELQAKLLRAVEQKEVWPLGAQKAETVDVRIIAASNEDLAGVIQSGGFREDLYYRLNVLEVRMPALREHREDVPLIARELLARISEMYEGRKLEVSDESLVELAQNPWAGNVRELASFLERAAAKGAALSSDATGPLQLKFSAESEGDAVPSSFSPETQGLSFKEAKSHAMGEWTRGVVSAALARNGNNVSKTARDLQMSRTALIRLIQRHQIT